MGHTIRNSDTGMYHKCLHTHTYTHAHAGKAVLTRPTKMFLLRCTYSGVHIRRPTSKAQHGLVVNLFSAALHESNSTKKVAVSNFITVDNPLLNEK